MALIESSRYSARDRAEWDRLERFDRALARSSRMDAKIAQARAALEGFEPNYIGVSWGKDSVAVAHMAIDVWPNVPLVWVMVTGWENPDCAAVRDAFLTQHPQARYVEIEAEAGANRAGGTSAKGFAEARRRFGRRYVSGVRAQESGSRTLRARKWGASSPNTCAPIIWWEYLDVFAYLARFDLPVHPAYACSMGGRLERGHLRVGSLGGGRGTGVGRAEWERHYYPEAIRGSS